MSGVVARYVVLGLLIERPGYGYDLGRRMEARLGFLGLSENAVYRILDRLEDDGLIGQVDERPTRRTRRGAARITYAPTPAGVVQFHAWVTRPGDRAAPRDELRAKMLLATPEDLPELLAVVEEQSRQCLAEIAQLQRPALARAAAPGVPWTEAAAILVDDFRLRWLHCLAEWLGAVRVVLEGRIEQHGGRTAAATE